MDLKRSIFPLTLLGISNFLFYDVYQNVSKTSILSPYFLVIFTTHISFMLALIRISTQAELPFLVGMFTCFNFIFLFLAPLAVMTTSSTWFVNNVELVSKKKDSFLLICLVLILSNLTIFTVCFSRKHLAISRLPRSSSILVKRLNYFVASYLLGLFLAFLVAREFVISLLPQGLGDLDNQGANLTLAQYGLGRAFLQTTPVIICLSFLELGKFKQSLSQKFAATFFASLSILLSIPLGSSRQMFLFALIPLIISKAGARLIARKALLCLIPLIVIFGQPFTFGITHSYSDVKNFGFSHLFTGIDFRVSSILVQGDFDSFSMFSIGLNCLKNGLHLIPGEQFLGVLLFWLPRSIWRGKPFDTALVIASANNFSFQNLSAPWVLELLINGGLFLLLLGSIILPVTLFRIDRKSPDSSRDWMRYAILCGSIFILLRGSLLQAFGVVAYALISINFLTSKNSTGHMRVSR